MPYLSENKEGGSDFPAFLTGGKVLPSLKLTLWQIPQTSYCQMDLKLGLLTGALTMTSPHSLEFLWQVAVFLEGALSQALQKVQ